MIKSIGNIEIVAVLTALYRGGTCVLVGLPPEMMEVPIFNTVLDGTRIIGSIVGQGKI